MQTKNLMQMSLRFLHLLCLSASLASCATEPVVNPNAVVEVPVAFGAQVGVNYTAEAIQWYSIGEAGGGGVDPYGTAGGICCAVYPRIWTPEFTVVVEWERSDCVGHERQCERAMEGDGTFPLKRFKKTVPVQKYTATGKVYIVFDPNDEIRVFVSKYGIGPGFLSYPQKPATAKKEKR